MRDSIGHLAIVLHVYYLDIAERLLCQLSWLVGREDYALWVTVPTERLSAPTHCWLASA